jgi:uncharacterized protein (DUF362 family)
VKSIPAKAGENMNKSIVSITKGSDLPKMIDETFSLLGGLNNLIKPNATIVVKPNAGHYFGPETSANTSPAVVAAVIKKLREANPKEIIVAEAAAVGCDTNACLDFSGIRQAALEAGADKIIDIKREKDLISIPIRDAKSAMNRVLLPRFLLEADHLINLPIFKTHVSMVFSCALKNMKGVVQDKVHHLMHETDLAVAMMDLWSVIKADLTIADLIRPGEGFGPHTIIPTDMGCIVGSQDPVAVDATVCRMVGLEVDKVAYFAPALERHLGVASEDLIEIKGKSIKEVFKKLWIPYMGGFDQWLEYNICSENACSSCQGLMAFTMEKLKAMGEYEKRAGATLVFGRKKELPRMQGKDLIIIGDCLKKFQNQGFFVKGCPPPEPYPMWAIVDRKSYFNDDDCVGFDLRTRMGEEANIFHDYILDNLKKNQK